MAWASRRQPVQMARLYMITNALVVDVVDLQSRYWAKRWTDLRHRQGWKPDTQPDVNIIIGPEPRQLQLRHILTAGGFDSHIHSFARR